eukprot:749418-Hanusia_phi.AAC.1
MAISLFHCMFAQRLRDPCLTYVDEGSSLMGDQPGVQAAAATISLATSIISELLLHVHSLRRTKKNCKKSEQKLFRYGQEKSTRVSLS